MEVQPSSTASPPSSWLRYSCYIPASITTRIHRNLRISDCEVELQLMRFQELPSLTTSHLATQRRSPLCPLSHYQDGSGLIRRSAPPDFSPFCLSIRRYCARCATIIQTK